jgi:hypothetical protein
MVYFISNIIRLGNKKRKTNLKVNRRDMFVRPYHNRIKANYPLTVN